jgi:periplasmic protein TonB
MRTKKLAVCFGATLLLSGHLSFTACAQSTSTEQAPGDTTSKKIIVSAPDGDEKVFEAVEVAASVNVAAWRRHLEIRLLPYIESAAKAKMKAGIYTVNVRFLVEKDGRITDVKALNDPGYGLAKGSEKVVRTGPRWTPGELNGKKVRSYHTQPITFSIQEEK